MPVRSAVGLDACARHPVAIELRFPAGDAETADVTLPAWCPGSYLIRDYARFVRDLEATGDDGAPRRVTKLDKTTWRIERAGASELVVRYTIYGHDLTIRTNHIDATHAFLHGPATFVHPVAHRASAVEVAVACPEGWNLTSAMAWDAAGGSATLRASSIDEL